jgi:hypothetical protein
MDFLNLLFGGGNRAYIEAALLVCFFWAALARPERIRSLTEFRLAYVFLGLSIITPTLLQLFVIGKDAGNPGIGNMKPRGFGMDPEPSTTMYLMGIPPLFTTLAVILGIDSVMPTAKSRKAERSEP